MKLKIFILSVLIYSSATVSATNTHLCLTSPDGRKTVIFDKSGEELTYRISFDNEDMILPSRAGLEVDNRIWEMALGKRDLPQSNSWMTLLEVDSVSYCKSTINSEWTNHFGERSIVKDCYNGATLHLSRHDKSHYRFDVEVRAYDEGIAFRYFFPEHKDAIFHKVVSDLTDYTFPDGTMAWSEQWAQARFDYSLVDSITHPVERALTLELPNNRWIALLDADVDDWCLTKYVSRNNKSNTLSSVMYSPVDVVTYHATPWKIIMMADSPGKLIENNDIVLNLNPKSDKDFSWVKPGKIMRSSISTEAGLQTIDFCAEHNISYMLYDWQWYMPCTSHDGDATQVIKELDLQKVINYGKEKGVGVWLYVNQHALMKQMNELFPILRQWGIVGVKSGFVQYASHRWATWLHDMVRNAAANQLMMNIHDEFRPSGFSRTYPNLLTQEGICGNEEFPDATHNVTLPFTRMLNGAADYTICYYDKRLENTHAHQLAASLVFFSPLQTIFWYDSPAKYGNEPEIEWFDNLETTFDDTKILSGYPGKHIVVARRKGNRWWIAAMTGNDGREIEIDFNFLESGTTYSASIYQDDSSVQTSTKVKVNKQKIKNGKTLRFQLVPKGGVALSLTPEAK